MDFNSKTVLGNWSFNGKQEANVGLMAHFEKNAKLWTLNLT